GPGDQGRLDESGPEQGNQGKLADGQAAEVQGEVDVHDLPGRGRANDPDAVLDAYRRLRPGRPRQLIPAQDRYAAPGGGGSGRGRPGGVGRHRLPVRHRVDPGLVRVVDQEPGNSVR